MKTKFAIESSIRTGMTLYSHYSGIAISIQQTVHYILTQTRTYIMTSEGHISSSTEWNLTKLQREII